MLIDVSTKRVPKAPKVKMKGGKPELFVPGSVRGVVLHQMACTVDRTSWTKEQAAARCMKIAAHYCALKRGLVVKSAPLEWIINHGNGFNRYAAGLEVEGLYAGTVGRKKKKHETPSPFLLGAAFDALTDLVGWLRVSRLAHNGPLTLWAHRQSSDDRRADPGEELWKPISHFAQTELGMIIEPALWLPASNPKNGKGRPIPKEWDSINGKGRY